MMLPLRKLSLTAHIAFSVGWIGAVASFLALCLVALIGRDAEEIKFANFAMDLIAWIIIVPMSLAALATGLAQALGTDWGLFRYYWVMAKLILTVAATIVLLMKMPLIDRATREATEIPLPSADLQFAEMQLMVHAAGGISVLLAITTISVVKPWGRIGYRQASMTSRRSKFIIPLHPADEANIARLFTSRRRLIAVLVALLIGFALLHLLAFHFVRGLGIHSH